MFNPKEFWLDKAEKLKQEKKIDEALECMEKVRTIEGAKNNQDFWYESGYACLEIGKYDESLECFNNHLEYNVADFDVLYQKGVALYHLNENLEAIECFNKAWELKYSEYLQTNDQVSALKDHKEFEKAIKYATKLTQMFSIPYQFWYFKGLALSKQTEFEKAIECFDEALSINPDNPMTVFQKSKMALALGNKQVCFELLDRACTLDPSIKDRIFTDIVHNLENSSDIRKIVYKD